MNEKIIDALTITAELTDTHLTKSALAIFANKLNSYPEEIVLDALLRCQDELKGRLTPASVFERIREMDGRPGPEEAYGLLFSGASLTEEIWAAHKIALPLERNNRINEGRMLFKEVYARLVKEARRNSVYPIWLTRRQLEERDENKKSLKEIEEKREPMVMDDKARELMKRFGKEHLVKD